MHQQCSSVQVCEAHWQRGATLGNEARGMKLVPDETGSREQRQRKGCFRQGKERTDLSLDTLPVALKKNISFLFFTIFF